MEHRTAHRIDGVICRVSGECVLVCFRHLCRLLLRGDVWVDKEMCRIQSWYVWAILVGARKNKARFWEMRPSVFCWFWLFASLLLLLRNKVPYLRIQALLAVCFMIYQRRILSTYKYERLHDSSDGFVFSMNDWQCEVNVLNCWYHWYPVKQIMWILMCMYSVIWRSFVLAYLFTFW